MIELKQGTWVVVTDSEKALFLRNLTDHENPNLDLFGEEVQENPSDREQGANRPGRMQDGGVQQRSAMADTDWHELQKERFAADLAEHLYDEAHKGAFERLVLVAAPKVLGDLREALHKEVSDRVIAEVPKTLTNHPVDKIEALVKKELETA
ncbi:host attachment family protein [Salipiger abyssi]|uniref:Protein required for attachment to host cells n=1 Tax=Salipiger abyssi TaxID=1250539 RepID=A0A1P8UR06_9RHOB|nr:host attachment family protein [Salipiger abyssi]APZ51845.1 protein required for attachment to host cells [Salipiger abyssi]MBN9889663.1 host attachment protein [Salipiger abyssi]